MHVQLLAWPPAYPPACPPARPPRLTGAEAGQAEQAVGEAGPARAAAAQLVVVAAVRQGQAEEAEAAGARVLAAVERRALPAALGRQRLAQRQPAVALARAGLEVGHGGRVVQDETSGKGSWPVSCWLASLVAETKKQI